MSFRTSWVSAFALIGAAALASESAPTVHFDIPAQPLGTALRQLADQTGLQLAVQTAMTIGKNAPAVRGNFSEREALEQLLKGSGLSFKFLDGRVVAIKLADEQVSADRSAGNGRLLVQAGTFATSQGTRPSAEPAQDAKTPSAPSASVGEIVVTAQKRAERLQDVPVPVTAIDAQMLATYGQLRVQDYYARIPGLGLALIGDGGSPSITIRGVTTGGQTNPTVAITVDDVPFGSSRTEGGGYFVPDIDPGDLARVEVLRGPQGTLYGASSIGGLLKFVTVEPTTDAVSGRLQAGVSEVRYGEMGHSLRGAINVPLGSTLAIRASGFTGRDPGYVDNHQAGRDNANHRDNEGGRVAMLWRPSDAFSLKLNAMVQDSERAAIDEIDTRLPGMQRDALPGTGGYTRKTQVYSAVVNSKLGNVDLTSVSGYNTDRNDTVIDLTLIPIFSSLASTNFGVPGAANPFSRRNNKFTQEIRALVPIGPKIDWLFGGFYTGERSKGPALFAAVDPGSGAVAGILTRAEKRSNYTEYAAFTNLTLHLTDRFDLQVGGRLSENEQTFTEIRSGLPAVINLFYGGVTALPEVRSKDTPFTYLVTPSFKVSPDLMVYARLASGYRPAGPNIFCTASVPCAYGADTSQNYEVGFKGDLLDRALSFDASLYYIDWKDIQINLRDPNSLVGYVDNAGTARSKGAELTITARPLRGLTITAWAAYNEAELTQISPTSTLQGRPGDRLPYSSPFSANVSLDQEFPLGAATGFVGGSASFVDDRKGGFRTLGRVIFPAYTQVDFRSGIQYGSWELSLFVNNLTDERGVLRGGLDSTAGAATLFTYIQPRTVGASLTKMF